ncbi:thermonuclease family protein [Sphingosinicella sp. CPCC 101087]|uniref:thermonuclease family protein n=1 Tax=Sphingosinicella sp. CPCC 101087 TaxID=2497754 RepID=UPI00101BD18C|nr:nuclease [Sphingosinicella sp. CPCC 101087]
MRIAAIAAVAAAGLATAACGAIAAQDDPDPSPATFVCDVLRVHDGDGPIHCRNGSRIRLSGIAARELDGRCLDGHPCPVASAEAAKAELDRLAVGRRLTCHQVGTSYRRVVAWCETPTGEDLSCAMVRSGTVLRWARHDPNHRLVGCSPT